jgi:hypothetical protein
MGARGLLEMKSDELLFRGRERWLEDYEVGRKRVRAEGVQRKGQQQQLVDVDERVCLRIYRK